MKRRKIPPLDLSFLSEALIKNWRKIKKLEIGPLNKLQTREKEYFLQDFKKLREEGIATIPSTISASFLSDWPYELLSIYSLMGEMPEAASSVLEITTTGAAGAIAASLAQCENVSSVLLNPHLAPRASELAASLGASVSFIELDAIRQIPKHSLDLLILSYQTAVNGIYDPRNGLSPLQNLFLLLKEDGYVLWVEPSVIEINRDLLQLRESFQEMGFEIAAPCIWRGPCPALAAKSPCIAQRPVKFPELLLQIYNTTEEYRQSLKCSYLLLKKSSKPLYEFKERAYRVISPMMKGGMYPRYYLCGVDGKKILELGATAGEKEKQNFENLQRGDVIRIENPRESGEFLRVESHSTFSLVTTAGKCLLGKDSK